MTTRRNYRTPAFSRGRRAPSPFREIQGGAFFLGKLNKTHNREQIYSALRNLANRYNFYIRKLDMPYGNKYTKEGNQGYCFVHCRSAEEAARIVALKFVNLGPQRCEVKAYGGRDSPVSSGYSTPVEPRMEPRKERALRSDLTNMLQTKYDVHARRARTPEVQEPMDTLDVEMNEKTAESTDEAIDIRDSEASSEEAIKESQPVHDDTNVTATAPVEFQQTPVPDHVYDCEAVNAYIFRELTGAIVQGHGEQFLREYFNAYERVLTEMQHMTPDQIESLATKHAPLVSNVITV